MQRFDQLHDLFSTLKTDITAPYKPPGYRLSMCESSSLMGKLVKQSISYSARSSQIRIEELQQRARTIVQLKKWGKNYRHHAVTPLLLPQFSWSDEVSEEPTAQEYSTPTLSSGGRYVYNLIPCVFRRALNSLTSVPVEKMCCSLPGSRQGHVQPRTDVREASRGKPGCSGV